MSTFLTNISAKSIRHLKELKIPLPSDKRTHLIITGKNGSGKTSVLLEMNQFLTSVQSIGLAQFVTSQKHLQRSESRMKSAKEAERLKIQSQAELFRTTVASFGKSVLTFSDPAVVVDAKIKEGTFLVAFFGSKRKSKVTMPTGINKVNLPVRPSLLSSEHAKFLQYIVNAKADRSFARDEGHLEEATRIDSWFDLLTTQFAKIFGSPDLKLVFDRKNYSFKIEVPGREPFGLDVLSDGYSAVLSIVTELIVRMEAHSHQRSFYDMEGLVLIDEIETHLHVDLQKQILPLLCDFFPNIQFVVTTHSPFVIASLKNTVICDLEKKIVTNDLSAYSYDTLLESYFGVDKYSEVIKEKVNEYEHLMSHKDALDASNKHKLAVLEAYLADTPKYLANELAVKLQQIKLSRIEAQKND